MPAYLETEQELSRLARRAAGMRGGPRLLILPGIMGSSIGHLRKNGGVDIAWFDPVEIAQGQLVKLALPVGNRYWAVGVLKFAYERLRLVLRIAGFDAVFHPYDWRRDIGWNGRELADRLLREKRQDVVVVAHSAGGLVARAALAHKGGERIGRVIQLGTPNKGVFVAVQALRGTYPLISRVAMLDLKHSADDLARKLLTTLPGLCDLLPAAQLCKDFDPFDPDQWPEGPRPAADLLMDHASGRRPAAARRAIPPDRRLRPGHGAGTPPLRPQARVRPRAGRRRHGAAGARALAESQDLVRRGEPRFAARQCRRRPSGGRPRRAARPRPPCRACCRSGRGIPTLWQEDVRAAPAPKIAWGDLSEREQREFLHEFVGVTQPSTAAAAPKREAAAKPVELAFMEGSITQSGAAAIVLGAFATSNRPGPPWPSTGCSTAPSATLRGGARSARRPAKSSCCRSAGAGSPRGWSFSPGSAISVATGPTCSGSPRRTSRARSRLPASRASRWSCGAPHRAPRRRTPRAPNSRVS